MSEPSSFDRFVGGVEQLLDAFTAQRSMTLLGVTMMVMFLALMVKANRSGDSRINLDYLFVDPATGTITGPKLAYTGSFAVTTYIVLFKLVAGDLTEAFFGYYLGAWSGAGILAFIAQRYGKTPPNLADDTPPPASVIEKTTLTQEKSVTPAEQPAAAQPAAAEASSELLGQQTIVPAKKKR